MPRIDPDDLPDPERVFVASSLRQARSVEDVLSGHGITYAVEVEEAGSSFLFGSPIHAAVFYVTASQADYCRTQLTQAGLRKGVAPAAGGDSSP